MPIQPPGLAHKGSISLSKETTQGTAATGTANVRYPLISAPTITPGVSMVESRSMNPNASTPRFLGQGPQQPRIRFEIEIPYEGFEHIIRAALPSVARAAGPPVVFTSKEAATDPFSYTVEADLGGIPTGKVNQMVGSRLIELVIAGRVGEMLTAQIEMAGMSITENVTALTQPTINADNGILWHHALAANILDGSGVAGADIELNSFELSLRIPHKTDRLYFGSVQPAVPVRIGNAPFRWSMGMVYSSHLLMNKARTNAAAAGGIELKFQGGTVSGGNYALQMKAQNPVAAEFAQEIPNFDLITQNVTWGLAYHVGDASAIVITTTNAGAALP